MFGRKRRKKKEAEQARPEHAAENQPQHAAEKRPLQPVRNGESAADASTAVAPRPGYDPKAAREMRSALQKALKRPVILPNERRFDQAKRTVMKHRRAVLGLAAVGTGIASVATAGAAAAILAICAASLPVLDFPTFFDTGVLDPNLSVTLESDAVALLLEMDNAGERAKTVQAAIDKKRSFGPDGRLRLSGEDIKAVNSPPQLAPGIHIPPVRVGVRMGFAVIGAGLLLLALTIIPQDIHMLMTRVASAILVVGALIVGAAAANGNWLKGIERLGYEARPDPD